MAATVRPVYYHVFYAIEPPDEKEPWRDGHDAHDLRTGSQCWCEPRAIQVAQGVVLVVHDPTDGLDLYEHRPTLDGL